MSSETPIALAFDHYRGRRVAAEMLEDLILVAVALRQISNQSKVGGERGSERLVSDPSEDVYAVVEAEGWQTSQGDIEKAIDQLVAAGSLWRHPHNDRAGTAFAHVSGPGLARAATAARQQYNRPLDGFQRQDDMFDGIGQIQVDFLGERLVIGCVEGEEDKALARLHRFEVDCGEVTKGVSGDLDPLRAAIMGGVIAFERIEELEAGRIGPEADERTAVVDQSSQDFRSAIDAIDRLVETVERSNSYRENLPEDHSRRLAELEAGRRLLMGGRFSITAVKATLWATVIYLAEKFIDEPIGEAASFAWEALKVLLVPYF